MRIDPLKITVIGHSRLGKTALLCAALDDRFYGAVSNDSGCSGAAVSLGKKGETIADITEQFPFWFCENYMKYAGKEKEAPFDQHFLLAAVAPRMLYVGNAEIYAVFQGLHESRQSVCFKKEKRKIDSTCFSYLLMLVYSQSTSFATFLSKRLSKESSSKWTISTLRR